MLADLIQSQPQLAELADAGDVGALVKALNAKTIERKNDALQGMRTIADKYGVEFAAVALGGLDAAGAFNPLFKGTYIAVCSTGIDFSNDKVQAALDILTAGGAWSVDVGTKLKELGVWHMSLANEFLGDDVTVDQVQAALVQRARQSIYAAVAAQYNATIAELDAGRVNTLAEAKAFFVRA